MLAAPALLDQPFAPAFSAHLESHSRARMQRCLPECAAGPPAWANPPAAPLEPAQGTTTNKYDLLQAAQLNTGRAGVWSIKWRPCSAR